jgi:hypothetical protein
MESGESPLLLDPCCDDPAKHLVFNDRGNVDPKRSRGKPSREGSETIGVCGLDRDGLVRDRRRMVKRMQFPMGRVVKAVRKLDARPGDPELEEELEEAWAELRSYATPDQPYSEMARQVIDRFGAQFTP